MRCASYLQFLDKASTLEYWEAFALHAFEASAQSIMMPVSLVGGSGNLVKCAACFSIKRDVFDLVSSWRRSAVGWRG